MMKTAIAVLFSTLSFPAWSCSASPPEQLTVPDDLIARTESIVLAKVVEATSPLDSHDVIYTFESVRTLKGKTSRQFQITGYPAIWEGENRNFSHHSDGQFWSRRGGRSANDTDCQIHPTFSVGGTYLIFLEQPYHVKSFEIITRTHGGSDTRDRWLQYVEARTGP